MLCCSVQYTYYTKAFLISHNSSSLRCTLLYMRSELLNLPVTKSKNNNQIFHCMINTSCQCSACLMHQFVSHNHSFLQCTLPHVRSESLNLPVTKLPLARRTDQVGVKGNVGLRNTFMIIRQRVSDWLSFHLSIDPIIIIIFMGGKREGGFPRGEWAWHLDLSPRAVEGWGSLRLVQRWPGWAGGVAWEGCGGHWRRMLLGRDGRVNRLRRGRAPYSALVKSQGNPHLCMMMLLALKIIVIAAIV